MIVIGIGFTQEVKSIFTQKLESSDPNRFFSQKDAELVLGMMEKLIRCLPIT